MLDCVISEVVLRLPLSIALDHEAVGPDLHVTPERVARDALLGGDALTDVIGFFRRQPDEADIGMFAREPLAAHGCTRVHAGGTPFLEWLREGYSPVTFEK